MDSKDALVNLLYTKFNQCKKDVKALCQILQDILEKMDNMNDNVAKELTKKLFDDLMSILKEQGPQFEDNYTQLMRNSVIKIIQRVCSKQGVNEYYEKIFEQLLIIAEEDNEENAILAVKTVQELLQKSSQTLTMSVSVKLEQFLTRLFNNFEGKYNRNFGGQIDTSSSMVAAPATSPSILNLAESEEKKSKLKLKASSRDSFKIVSECYVILVLVMGLGGKTPNKKILSFLPIIVQALEHMPPKEVQMQKKEKFLEFMIAENKIFSLVGFLLRIHEANDELQKQSKSIARNSIKFLKNCPPDTGLRRSFLITLKNIITSFIDSYLEYLRDIFDFNTLMGYSADRNEVKAEAANVIVNVSHFVRSKLIDDDQRELVLYSLIKLVNDSSIALSPQSGAVTMINKYIEDIFKMKDNQRILMDIVQVLTLKFKSMAKYLPKSYERRINQRIVEDKKKQKEGKMLAQLILRTSAESPKEKLSETKFDRDLEFYVETGKGCLRIENDKEKEISELLRETKQLIQRIIALMQSVLNTLYDCCKRAGATRADGHTSSLLHLSESHLEQISKLFHYGLKYFVAKATIYKKYGRNITSEEQDLEKNIKFFMEVFIQRLDLASFGHIMEKEIGFFCKCITKPEKRIPESLKSFDDKREPENDFLLKICQIMKDYMKYENYKPFSTAFAHYLARYLLKKFKNIGGYKKMEAESNDETMKFTKTLCLFRTVMEMLPMLNDDENVHVIYFNFIVLSAKYSRKAKSFYHYFSVIKSVCKAILNKSTDPPKTFAALMPGLLSIILNVRQECSVVNDLLTEILLYFPVNLRNLVEYLPTLVRPLIDCVSTVKIANHIALNALKNFEHWLAALNHFPEIMDPLFAPILPEFIGILHKLFTYQHYTPSIHKILGKFGGKSRLYMTDKEAYTKSYPDEGLRMAMHERTTGTKIVVGMDVGLDASFRYLESTTKLKNDNVKSIYKLVKAAYYCFMDASYDAQYIRACYAALKKNNYTELKQLAEECLIKTFSSNEYQVRVTPMKRDSQRHALEKLLTEIFYMTAVYYTREGYTQKLVKFFYFVCEHLVLIGLCRNGWLTLGQVDEIDPQTYLNVITEFLNESKDAVYPSQKYNQITCVAIEAITHIAKTYALIYGKNPEILNKVQLLDLLIQKIYSLCYWREWTKKEGSSLALSALFNILPKEFFYPYELAIIEALVYAINNLPRSITVTAHQSVPKTLYQLIQLCHSEPLLKRDSTGDFSTQYPKQVKTLKGIAHILCSQLKAEKKIMRSVAIKCIESLLKIEKLTLKEFMTLDSMTITEVPSAPGTESMIIGGEAEKQTETSLVNLLKSIFSARRWSEEFKKYNYTDISSNLDCLSYLLTHDNKGDLIGCTPGTGDLLNSLNNELLEIIKEEITSFEDKKRASTEVSIQNSYMLIEKSHNYFNPIYDQSVGMVYNYQIISEKDRLADASLEIRDQLAKKEIKPLVKDRSEAAQANPQDDELARYTAEIMKVKDQSKRPNMLNGDSYIYKVYPKSESRLKAVCKCMLVLCDEFEKLKKETAFVSMICPLERSKEEFKQQRFKYTVTLLRLLLREEKCIIHTAKACMKRMLVTFSEKDDLLPSNVFILCLRQSLQSKYFDLVEYKKMMRVVKLFPKFFGEGLWRKFAESLNNIKTRLAENAEKPDKMKSDTEFFVASYLISSYRHMDALPSYSSTFFSDTIEQARKLQELIYIYGRTDVSYKESLAHMFNKFSAHALEYLKNHIDLLPLYSGVAKVKKATNFIDYLSINAIDFFIKVIETKAPEATLSKENYLILHEILSLIYTIDQRIGKGNVEWMKRIKNLIEKAGLCWCDFKDDLGDNLKIEYYLQEDFHRVQKLLVNFALTLPSIPDIPFLLLNFFKHSDYIDVNMLKHFFCYELPKKIPSEAVKEYVKVFSATLADQKQEEERQCQCTSYIMIPIIFHIFKAKTYDMAFTKETEEEMLKSVFSERVYKLSVQKKLMQLGTLILENLANEKLEYFKKLVMVDIWKKIKGEDHGIKSWAFLSLAKFASKKLFPNERIQEVIYYFLMEPMGEYKEIINEAIDTLVPVLYPPGSSNAIDQNLIILEKAMRTSNAALHTLHNVFSMVVRNPDAFKPYKSSLYSRMIQAFQKIFFFGQQHYYKSSAFDIAKTMLSWCSIDIAESRVKEMENQIKEIILSCLFKELFFLHSILSSDDSLDKDPPELTYKCLALFKSILVNNPGIVFKISASIDKATVHNLNKESIVHLTMLNTVRVLLKYYRKDKIEENLRRILDALKIVFSCKWGGKMEQPIQQKHPLVIEGIIKFYVLLAEAFPGHVASDLYPALANHIKLEFSNFKGEVRQFDKNRDEDPRIPTPGTGIPIGAQGMQPGMAQPQGNINAPERQNMLKENKEKIFFMTPHLAVKLLAQHEKLGLSEFFAECLDEILTCIMHLSKIFTKYLKSCKRMGEDPFMKGINPNQQPPQQQVPGPPISSCRQGMPVVQAPEANALISGCSSENREFEWDWLKANDPDISIIKITGFAMDCHTRDTLIQAIHFLTPAVFVDSKERNKYLEIIVMVLEKECVDETMVIEVIKCARKILMEQNIPKIFTSPKYAHCTEPFSDLDKSKVLGKLLEQMPVEFETANNDLLELAHDFLKQVVEIKDYHKKLLHYILLQLRNKSLSLRNKFFRLFDKYCGTSIFKRFEYIFFIQKWMDIKDQKDTYWIQQALDLLMSSICDNEPMQREPDSLVLLRFSPKSMLPLPTVEKESTPSELEAIITSNGTEIEKMKKKKTRFWLDPLKDVTNWETHICEKLWLKLFPQFWNLMSPDEQQQLACFIEPFITKEEYLKNFQGKKQNPIRTIFEGIVACDPTPKVAPEIIQYIGKNYSTWHTAIPILESYLYTYPNNERFAICMQELYRRLSEKEYIIGMQKVICKSPITQAGLSYLQYGMWEAAFDLFESAISKNIKCGTDKTSINELENKDFTMTLPEEMKRNISQMDLRIWEDGLIEAAQQLNQWELVKSPSIPKMKQILKYNWSMRYWQDYISAASSLGENEDSTTMLAALYNYMGSQKEDEGEQRDNIYKRGLKSVYQEWNYLPAVVDVSHYNSIILQQHYLESSEFKNMCKEIKDSLGKPPGPDVKTTLNGWRERLPNKCEPFSVWKDLLECRNFMFKAMLTKFSSIKFFEYYSPILHDIPWNLLKLAEMARKHGLTDQALNYLSEVNLFMKDSDNFPYEKFLQVKETAKLALRFDKESDDAIAFLESVENKDYLAKNASYLSEIFRLKGKIFSRRNKRKEALDALKKSTELCNSNYQAWLSYALFCDKLFHEERKDKDPSLAISALKGYINAAAYMISKSKFIFPKIFNFLDSKIMEHCGMPRADAWRPIEDAFKGMSETIPIWVWIYWIPELLSGLSRSLAEYKISFEIMGKIARLYPQSICLPLYRMIQRFDCGLEKGREEIPQILDKLLKAVKDIEREAIKAEQIKCIMDELEKNVLASLSKEDELLIHLRKLLNACIPICETSVKAVGDAFKKIYVTYFGNPGPISVLYKEKFKQDFDETAIAERPLAKTLLLVNNWIDFLHTKLSLRTEQKAINGYSPVLANMVYKRIEMFGCNYSKDVEPAPENSIYIVRIETKVDKSFMKTKVEFRGSNERSYNYYLEFYNDNEKLEVYLSQLRQVLNTYFYAKRHTHIRNVKLYSPYSIYWNKMRVTMDETSMMRMKDIHDASLIERGYHPDLAIVLYLEKYLAKLQEISSTAPAPGNSIPLSEKDEKDLLHNVIKEMKVYFPDYIFSSYIHKLISNPDELFIYKKQFTSYLAAISVFTYIFGLINKDFSTMMFCKKTGKIYFTTSEFYNKIKGIIVKNDGTVPFRLTPNLSNFVTQVGIYGPFLGAISSTALSIEGSKAYYFASYLKLFFKEVLEREEAESPEILKKNCEKVIKDFVSLMDPETIKKLFNYRHQVFKTETVRGPGSGLKEEKAEDDRGYWKSIDIGAQKKIDESMDEKRLEEMKLEWAPWF